ncbi:MAG: acyl-CoA thioesterase [Longimicrobiales bacterium]
MPIAAMHHTTHVRVRYAETDQMGVAYHAHYLVWCEVARTDLIRAAGTPYRALEEAGVRLAVVDAAIRYHAAASYDDLIRIDTQIERVRSRGITFRYEMVREAPAPSVHLASAHTTLIATAADGSVRRLPRHVRNALAEHGP